MADNTRTLSARGRTCSLPPLPLISERIACYLFDNLTRLTSDYRLDADQSLVLANGYIRCGKGVLNLRQ